MTGSGSRLVRVDLGLVKKGKDVTISAREHAARVVQSCAGHPSRCLEPRLLKWRSIPISNLKRLACGHEVELVRVLLVEDDPRLAKLISGGLSEDGLIVDHAANATVGLNMTELETFDLFIFDVMLPEGREAGFELERVVRARHDHTPILFLTARADMDSKVTGLETGGDDYLAKPFDFRELHARIRALVRRSKGGSSNVVNLPLGLRLDIGAKELVNGIDQKLTPREYALLECFALNPGRAYSRGALIERVWPEDTTVELKVVDVYVSTVRRKLGEGIIETVRGTGYRLGKLEPIGGTH